MGIRNFAHNDPLRSTKETKRSTCMGCPSSMRVRKKASRTRGGIAEQQDLPPTRLFRNCLPQILAPMRTSSKTCSSETTTPKYQTWDEQNKDMCRPVKNTNQTFAERSVSVSNCSVLPFFLSEGKLSKICWMEILSEKLPCSPVTLKFWRRTSTKFQESEAIKVEKLSEDFWTRS